jgi:hypothetical protein
MSNIFIRDIVGDTDFSVPTNDTELNEATTELDNILSGVANLSYDVLLAWVETKDGAGAPRSLNCSLQTFTYSGEECPDSSEVQTMTTTIEASLVQDHGAPGEITSIGEQQVSLFVVSYAAPWLRDSAGFVQTRVATDDIYVGGATPNSRLYDDGRAAFGAAAVSGSEKVRVAGGLLVEGKLTVTGTIDPTDLVLDEQTDHPTAPAAGKGILWVRDDTPNVLVFTDDDGTDTVLGTGGSSPWTEAAGVLYPSTPSTDDVVIGDSSMVGNERLLVINKDPAGGSNVAVRAAIDTDDSTVTVSSWQGVRSAAQVETNDTVNFASHFRAGTPAGAGTIGAAYGLYVEDLQAGSGTVTNSWGIYQDGTTDKNVLQGQTSIAASTMSGTEKLRVSGDVRIDADGQLLIADSATDPPLNITERSAAPSGPAANDIYLDDGTNTASGSPGWRRYTGAVWEDVSAGGGGSSPWTDGGAVLYPTNDEDVAIGAAAMAGAERLRVRNSDTSGTPSAVLAELDTGGSLTSWAGLHALPDINSGHTVTTSRGVLLSTPTGTGVVTSAYGVDIEDQGRSSTTTYGVRIQDQTGTTAYGLYQAGTDDQNVFLGDVAVGVAAMSGTEKLRVSGDVRVDANGQLLVADSATDPPLNITERSAAPSGPAANDIYLDDGTNTASGNPGWRRYTGAVWEDISAGAGGGTSPWTYVAGPPGRMYPSNSSDNDRVVLGTTTLTAGNPEMLRIFADPNEGETIGVYVQDDDNDFLGGNFTGYVAELTTASGSSGQFVGYKVQPPSFGSTFYTIYGFYYPNMVGTAFQGTRAFFQEGPNEQNQFNGYSGFGASAIVGTTPGHRVVAGASSQTQDWIAFFADFGQVTLPSNVEWTGYSTRARALSGGTIDKFTGYEVNAPTSGGIGTTTCTLAYGVYIDDLQSGVSISVTNSYGVYQAGSSDVNVFQGDTVFGGTSVSSVERVRVRTTQTSGTSYGVLADYDAPGSGSATGYISYESDMSVPTGHTLALGYHFRANTPTGSGTLTTCIGVRIDEQNTGPVGTGYGILQAGFNDLNRLNGLTGIGDDAQTDSQLYVSKVWAPGSSQTRRNVIEAYGGWNASGLTCSTLPVISAEAVVTTGTVTSLAGLRVFSPTVGGTVSNCHGVFIEQQDVSGVGQGYGIYQASSSDLNYFGGVIGVNDVLPNASYGIDAAADINVQSGSVYRANGLGGASGSFITANTPAKIVTVTSGIITSIV